MSEQSSSQPEPPSPNSVDSSNQWAVNLRAGDPESQREVWEKFFERLVSFAKFKINDRDRRLFDEEDVALSAMHSLFRAVKEERVTKLDDPLDLWKLLVVIASRKISRQRAHHGAAKRGGGQVRGESIFIHADDRGSIGLEAWADLTPTPQLAAEVSETCDTMLAALDDDTLRQVATLKLDGHSHAEIATKLGCVERTVRRKVERIQAIWQEAMSGSSEQE